ncbi:hypothetical protein TUBRATIS_11260 [Tubulinosema ratisbonensis]|uniref:Uncharacterized protein n=1 Tax=Tubulinosema ratisbonensis TaxID=291195 RepID=A0A437AMJ3_9MICR|nr:hypothetical protein TUBRATIS_11260 [Tubulinosema ratisbonensis]
MEEKNKKLAEKNTKLKEELDKLQVFQKRLLKENINTRFFSNVMHQKMINMLETNLENIENALSNTIKMKNEICPKIKQNKIEKINFKNIENEERTKAENVEKVNYKSNKKEEEFSENNPKSNENEKEKINLENKEFFSELHLKRKEKTNKTITKKRKKKRLLNMKRK